MHEARSDATAAAAVGAAAAAVAAWGPRVIML